MNAPTLRSAARLCGIVAVALLVLLAPHIPAGAQGTLSLAFMSQYDVHSTSNDATIADYEPNIILSPAGAELECAPALGHLFPRGGTEVSCTATLGDQTATGSFYVLVAKSSGDTQDTDVELGPISQDPSPIEPAGFVTYNVEFRPTVPATAERVVISTTLPPHLRLLRTSNPNCDTRALPTITCTLFSVQRPDAFQITVQSLAPYQGTFRMTWTLALGNGQRDLLAANNTASIETVVRVAQAPNQLFLPALRK